MEKSIKVSINANSPQAKRHYERLEALGAELEEKGLGKVDYKSTKVFYDEKDKDAVMHLLDKYLHGTKH